jgi:hypothetical protein
VEVDSTFEAEKSPIFISTKYRLNYKNLQHSLPGICEQIKLITDHHKNDKGIIHTHSNDITSFVKGKLGSDRYLYRETNTTNEDINITDDNNIVNDVLVPVKKSFLEAVKTNH